jgi:hypothetical protein
LGVKVTSGFHLIHNSNNRKHARNASRFEKIGRRGRESNPRIAVLQTATLPLGYPAIATARDYRVPPSAVNARRFNDSTISRIRIS